MKRNTMGEQVIQKMRGHETFSQERLNPHIHQSMFGVQGGNHNNMRSNPAHSQSNMGSVMSTASLGPHSKGSNMHRSNSGGQARLTASLQRALNPPTVTSIDMMDHNRESVVVQDQLAYIGVDEQHRMDSRVSSMQNIRRASLVGSLSRDKNSEHHFKETNEDMEMHQL